VSGDAVLIYDIFENEEIIQKEVEVFVDVVDIYGKEFYLSYQSGLDVKIAFEVNYFEFEETKHIEQYTNKPLYANKIRFEDAEFDIVRYQNIKDEKTLLVCS